MNHLLQYYLFFNSSTRQTNYALTKDIYVKKFCLSRSTTCIWFFSQFQFLSKLYWYAVLKRLKKDKEMDNSSFKTKKRYLKLLISCSWNMISLISLLFQNTNNLNNMLKKQIRSAVEHGFSQAMFTQELLLLAAESWRNRFRLSYAKKDAKLQSQLCRRELFSTGCFRRYV